MAQRMKSLKSIEKWLEALCVYSLVPRDGIEPTTPAFSVLCSTN